MKQIDASNSYLILEFYTGDIAFLKEFRIMINKCLLTMTWRPGIIEYPADFCRAASCLALWLSDIVCLDIQPSFN